eukprot:6266938-Pyramimonas_sp.AAC.1
MVTNNTAAASTTPVGQPGSSSSAAQATAAITPATDTPVSLVAEPANNAGAPAATAPAGPPATEMWLRRMDRASEREARIGSKYHMHACPTGVTSARTTSVERKARRAHAAAP